VTGFFGNSVGEGVGVRVRVSVGVLFGDGGKDGLGGLRIEVRSSGR